MVQGDITHRHRLVGATGLRLSVAALSLETRRVSGVRRVNDICPLVCIVSIGTTRFRLLVALLREI